MDRLRIAMFVAKFNPTLQNPWLTDELCEAFDKQGHMVDVFFLDWYREFIPSTVISHGNTRVHIIAPLWGKSGLISKVLHWTLSSFNLYKYYRSHFERGDHDVLVSFSPSIIFGIVLLRLRSYFRHRILIQWDFFPYHQEQIGLFPFRWMASLGATIETALLNTFSQIGCMSPKNVAYLQEHYKLSPDVQTTVLPIWSKTRMKPLVDKTAIRKQFGLPIDAFIAVFGGQITAGRGIEDIVEMARLAHVRADAIVFLVVGSGPKAAWLETQAKDLHGRLIVLPTLTREGYLKLIATCDVGLVLTVPNVDVPSFPSKTLDYCCVGIPVAAAVEQTTDYGEFIVSAGIGRYCEAGDPSGLLKVISDLSGDPELLRSMGISARKHYETYFNVDSVAASIVEMVRNG
jgi:glycosyltransferase involved in cell wall biosynthesis